MSRIIIIGNPPPPPTQAMASTMADSQVDSLEFDVQYEGEDLTLLEQAELLRAAADQLDPPINGKNED